MTEKPTPLPGADDASPRGAEGLAWSVHPAAERPALAVAVLLAVAGAGAAALTWVDSVAFGLLSAGLLLIAVLPFLLRTHYSLRGRALEVRTALYRFERDLSAFRAFESSERVIWLCTLSRRSRLDSHRGMALHLAGNADEVRAALLATGLEERR